MSLSSTNHINEYPGDGADLTFDYTFRILNENDLRVMVVVDATAVETLQVITTDYTVSGVGDIGGGTVTFVSAPASGETVILGRYMDLGEQPIDLANQGAFQPDTLEEGLDRLAMILNQIETRGTHPTYTTATRPTACSYWRGRVIHIKDSGSPGHLETCLEKDAGSWHWVTSVAGPV